MFVAKVRSTGIVYSNIGGCVMEKGYVIGRMLKSTSIYGTKGKSSCDPAKGGEARWRRIREKMRWKQMRA